MKSKKLLISVIGTLLLTGCTKTLTDENNNIVTVNSTIRKAKDIDYEGKSKVILHFDNNGGSKKIDDVTFYTSLTYKTFRDKNPGKKEGYSFIGWSFSAA